MRECAPNMAVLARLDHSSVIVTAAGDVNYDFVSHHFAPAKGILEDPVNCLSPLHVERLYWAKRLGKTAFRVCQASLREGEAICRLVNARIELQGTCIFYLEGEAEI